MKRVWGLLALLAVAVLAGAAVWLYTPDASRAALEAKYWTASDSTVEVAGIGLHVRDSGPKTAPVVILLHGFGSSLLTFDAWAEALSAEFRVLRYDLPGFGLTGPDPTGDYSEERGIAVLSALMDRLDVRRASLVGNSMGGRLAWRFAAAHPDRVDKLVLISPDGFASAGFHYGKPASVPFAVRAFPFILPESLLRGSLAPAYADPAKITDAVLARYRDMLLAPGVRGAVVTRLAQTVLVDPEPILRTLTAPTLILWGEGDRMIPVRNADDYRRDIPGSRLVVLPGLGHVPFEEAPEVSLAPLKAFLAP